MSAKQKRSLALTLILIALIQMPTSAILPAVNKIYTEVFTDHTLSSIQTSMLLTGIMSPISALLMAFLIRRGVISKRAVVVFGLFLLGFVGVLAILLNRHFWCLALLSALMGCAAGCYVSTATSVLVDCFEGDECRRIAGIQAIFLGLGGAALSVSCGFLANTLWYGGYIVLMIAIPIGILALFSVPGGRLKAETDGGEKAPRAKFNYDVLYYALAVFLLLFIFTVATGNISVHFDNAGIRNFSTAAGFAVAVQMLGSAAFGFCFRPLSARFGDMLIPAAFVFCAAGLTIINLCDFSLPLMYLGIAINGMSMSMLNPQCVMSVSKRVDPSNSAIAGALLHSAAPGIGAFLSPVIITNITMAIAGNSTKYRYQFTAFVALAFAAIFFFCNLYRSRKSAGAPYEQTGDDPR